jgi:two-component system sensor histidine kinase ChvG
MIATRLLAFNLLVLFLPAAGILYLDVYETRLLAEQERSMVQQARLMAAALGDRGAIDAAAAADLLKRLGDAGDARLRIYDANGALAADSIRYRTPRDTEVSKAQSYGPPPPGIRGHLLYRVGTWFVAARRVALRAALRVRPVRGAPVPVPAEDPPPQPVRAALAGRYGAMTRPTPGQRSMTMFSAVPVRGEHGVIGAALVTQTTFRSLQALYAVRLRIFEIIVASIAAAAAMTALAAATVVRPLGRLRREASDLAARRARLPGRFEGVDRRDEIGDLARSLQELTSRLDEHIRAVEQFAGDVSHEFRNPLASIRSAAEMTGQAGTAPDRHRFLDMLTRDVDRLERLVAGVRQLALIDRQIEDEPLSVVDVGALLQQVVDGRRIVAADGAPISLSVRLTPASVRGSTDRLVQVFENVLGNAQSFAPASSVVEVSVERDAGRFCRIAVADRGPGIPPAHLDRLFDRFFSYRPASPDERTHTGLGLSIARSIVHGCGGTIAAENRPGGGACFVIRLPLG